MGHVSSSSCFVSNYHTCQCVPNLNNGAGVCCSNVNRFVMPVQVASELIVLNDALRGVKFAL